MKYTGHAMNFENERKKYKPHRIKYIFIAESPPKPESKRFFYIDEGIKKGDSLFLSTMKALYKDVSTLHPSNIRARKTELLERFQKDGFYLIDASESSIAGQNTSRKKKELKKSLAHLVNKLRNTNGISKNTKIILISSTVYAVCAEELKSKGFNVINKGPIKFPIGNWQEEFIQKMSALVA